MRKSAARLRADLERLRRDLGPAATGPLRVTVRRQVIAPDGNPTGAVWLRDGCEPYRRVEAGEVEP